MARTARHRNPVIKILALGDSGVGKSTLLNYFTDGIFTANFSSTVGVDFKDKNLVRRRRRRLPSFSESDENQRIHISKPENINGFLNNSQIDISIDAPTNLSDDFKIEHKDFSHTMVAHEDNYYQSEWHEDSPDHQPKLTDTTLDQWEEERFHLQLWDTAGQERFRSLTTTFFRDAMGFLLMFDLTHAQSLMNIQIWLEQLNAHAYKDDPALVLVGAKSDLVDERAVDRTTAEELAEGLGVGYYETSAVSGEHVCESVYHLLDVILKKQEQEVEMRSRHSSMGERDGDGIRVEGETSKEHRVKSSICGC